MATADETLRALRRALAEGVFPPDTKLPPERDLAARLRVGRGTLRKAFDALEREGLIRRRVGHGTFVQKQHAGYDAGLVLDAPPTPANVMETRLLIEPSIAATAAIRATAETIAALVAIAEAPGDDDWREWERRDNAFHTALAGATGNPLLVGFLETLHQMRRGDDWSRLRRLSHNSEIQTGNIEHHKAIVAAIKDRDADGAARAMRRHLEAVQARMMAQPATARNAVAIAGPLGSTMATASPGPMPSPASSAATRSPCAASAG
jgi:DNA-binding FadR family transcriptional regulator